jgi:AcrR family transcriptional regulator
VGVKTPKVTDRRVQRTHRTLRDALIGLILERGWEEVSVQALCDRANVGRSTFYAHFASKEDLLTAGLGELRKTLRQQHGSQTGSSGKTLGFARGIIEHVHEQQRLFRAIVGKRSGHVVQTRFRQFLIELVQEDLAGLARPGSRRDATVHYVAGAFYELLTWWLDTRNPLQPSEVEELFHRLTTPVLAALRALD